MAKRHWASQQMLRTVWWLDEQRREIGPRTADLGELTAESSPMRMALLRTAWQMQVTALSLTAQNVPRGERLLAGRTPLASGSAGLSPEFVALERRDRPERDAAE
jgi:hypothetical protein